MLLKTREEREKALRDALRKKHILYIESYMTSEPDEFREIIEANQFEIIRCVTGTTDIAMSKIVSQFIRLIPQDHIFDMLAANHFEAFKSIIELGNLDAFITLIDHALAPLNDIISRVEPSYFIETLQRAESLVYPKTAKMIFFCYRAYASTFENHPAYLRIMESLLMSTWREIRDRSQIKQDNAVPKFVFNLNPCEIAGCFYILRCLMKQNAQTPNILAFIESYLTIPAVKNLVLCDDKNELLDLAMCMPGKGSEPVVLFLRQVGFEVLKKLDTCGELGRLMLKESNALIHIAEGSFPIGGKAALKLMAILKALHHISISPSTLNEQQLCEALKVKESELNVALTLGMNGNEAWEPDGEIIREINDAWVAMENSDEARVPLGFT